MKFQTILLTTLLTLIQSHGTLNVPAPRGLNSDIAINAPVPNDISFVCQNLPAESPQVTLTAGETLDTLWKFGNHIGDCAFYLSYDTNKPEAEMEWFKIDQQANCQDLTNTNYPITIPDYLKSSEHAVLRFEWITVDRLRFWTYCVDVKIVGDSDGTLGTPRVKIPGHLSNDLNDYRRADAQSNEIYFAGPEIASADEETIDELTESPPPLTDDELEESTAYAMNAFTLLIMFLVLIQY